MDTQIITTPATGILQLSPITINDDYRKKWNIGSCNDFVHLTIDGQIVNDSLLRVGGIGHSDITKRKYFMLLKYNEAYYDDSIEKDKNKKRHLQSRWCIFNHLGNLKFEADPFKNPYIVNNSCIYSLEKSYFNIDTGFYYCSAYDRVESSDFLFLQNSYDNDVTKRGVWKINKQDETYEIFPIIK